MRIQVDSQNPNSIGPSEILSQALCRILAADSVFDHLYKDLSRPFFSLTLYGVKMTRQQGERLGMLLLAIAFHSFKQGVTSNVLALPHHT